MQIVCSAFGNAVCLAAACRGMLCNCLSTLSDACASGVARSIIQFREVFLTPDYLAIAMEFAPGGDMFQYVKRKKGLQARAALPAAPA